MVLRISHWRVKEGDSWESGRGSEGGGQRGQKALVTGGSPRRMGGAMGGPRRQKTQVSGHREWGQK